MNPALESPGKVIFCGQGLELLGAPPSCLVMLKIILKNIFLTLKIDIFNFFVIKYDF
jgi:hypothetical protein